ncbi:hypothetical protein [Psychrobacter urativorans]|nr:hypothetical protein [Psychrobacter urativorans]
MGIFIWLWSSNRKNADPLPIMNSENQQLANELEDDINAIPASILQLQAEEKLQAALDDVITVFESRHPNVQVLARYVPTQSLLDLPDTSMSNHQPDSFMNADIIMTDKNIDQTQLSALQTVLDDAQNKRNKKQVNTNAIEQDNKHSININAETNNNEIRNLASFSYALKGKQAVDGVILTDNPIAVSFRNFLLSSAGQDVLSKYKYDNIDGYKNSVDDLFNPSSRTKNATGQPSVKIAEALSNGK